MELHTAYLTFWVIIVGYLILTIVFKAILLQNVSDSDPISIFGWIQHGLEILHFPDVMTDWDQGLLKLNEIDQKWDKVWWEMVGASILHWMSTLIFIVPAIFTGENLLSN